MKGTEIIESRRLFTKLHLAPALVVASGGRISDVKYTRDGMDEFLEIEYAGRDTSLKIWVTGKTKMQMLNMASQAAGDWRIREGGTR